MVHATQDKLQGAPFGTDDQIDACQIALKLLIELVVELQQQADEAGAQRGQYEAEAG